LLSTISKEGLRLTGITEIATQVDKTANSINDLATYDPNIVFISTKACILKAILPEIRKTFNPEVKIISYQNGMDNEQIIAQTLELDTTYRVVINYAGNKINLGTTKMNWFQPPNYIGALHKGKYTTDETTAYIARMMTNAGLMTEEDSNIKRRIWEKTILNSALCSICAVTGQTMKEAMEFRYSHDLAVKIIEEGLKVANEDGYYFGKDALDKFTRYLEKGGAHKPSMLVDVENKRPIEVDFMSGAIARYGEKFKIRTPVNSTFTNLLKTIENRYM
jgi:2-dehydropantoate 2-reductase